MRVSLALVLALTYQLFDHRQDTNSWNLSVFIYKMGQLDQICFEDKLLQGRMLSYSLWHIVGVWLIPID